MGLNKVKENIKKIVFKAVFLSLACCVMLLDKIYVQADLIIENPNIEYAKEENVTTTLDIIVIVIIAALVILAIIGIYRMKKKARQDSLDDETRMMQNKKEQDL